MGSRRNTTSSFSTVQIDAQNRVIVGGRDAKAGIVFRYKASGTLDSSWKPYHLNPGYGAITGIAIVGTKTLVSATGNGSKKAGYLIRLNADGRRDQTFGVDGIASGMGCWRCGRAMSGSHPPATSSPARRAAESGSRRTRLRRHGVTRWQGRNRAGLSPDPSEMWAARTP